MKSISLETLKELTEKGWLTSSCMLCGFKGRTQLHHNLIFGGSQSSEAWTIIEVCYRCHSQANNPEVRDKLDLIMLNRVSDEILKPFCKVKNWIERKRELNLRHRK